MDQVEKSNIINLIQAKFVYCIVNGKQIVLCHPSSDIKSMASFIYERELLIAENNGMISRENLLEICYHIGVWTMEKSDQIRRLGEQIYNIKKSLLDFVFQKNKLESHRKILRNNERMLLELIGEQGLHLKSCAENYATMKQQRFLMCHMAKDIGRNLLWKDMDDMNNNTDISLINRLIEIYFDNYRIKSSVLREIARSEPWRSMWKAGKSCNDLFNTSVCDWSENQLELCRWSDLYDSINACMDRPSDDIIDDDDLLDSWIIRQNEKEKSKNKANLLTNKSKNAKGRQEIFIFADRESAKDIYGANDPMTRINIQAKQQMINNAGELPDEKAPDSINEMRQKLKLHNVSRKNRDISRR